MIYITKLVNYWLMQVLLTQRKLLLVQNYLLMGSRVNMNMTTLISKEKKTGLFPTN